VVTPAELLIQRDVYLAALEDLANCALLVWSGGDTAHLDDALKKADDILVEAGRWRPMPEREDVT
jgi:hypothetical protein